MHVDVCMYACTYYIVLCVYLLPRLKLVEVPMYEPPSRGFHCISVFIYNNTFKINCFIKKILDTGVVVDSQSCHQSSVMSPMTISRSRVELS